jgi:hypothetical protein
MKNKCGFLSESFDPMAYVFKKKTYSFSMLKSMLLVDSFSLMEEVLV